ncbi:MAG: YeeE/YedE family protein [Chloroflexota bacterium]
MAEFNWMAALIGGILIGISSTMMLAWNGRITAISGMVHMLVTPRAGDINWRWIFLIGMIGGGALYEYMLAPTPTPEFGFAPIAMILSGLIVGFGTRMGNGCTSGHGVCGLGRLSLRSLVAVITFLTASIVTVFIIRHLLSGVV